MLATPKSTNKNATKEAFEPPTKNSSWSIVTGETGLAHSRPDTDQP